MADGKLLYSTGNSAPRSVITWRGGGAWSWREAREGGDICVHVADSHCSTVETNNTVNQLYFTLPPQKKKNREEIYTSHVYKAYPFALEQAQALPHLENVIAGGKKAKERLCF